MSAIYHYLETVEEAGGERHYIDGVFTLAIRFS